LHSDIFATRAAKHRQRETREQTLVKALYLVPVAPDTKEKLVEAAAVGA
jgi:hypothetical protein